MEKIINKLIDLSVKGCDVYYHKGSTWLIFTDTKQWVIELTEDRTLWYNYNFFNNLFSYVSMDVVENEHYITKWVENNIINGIRGIAWGSVFHKEFIDDVIENGIQEPLRVQDLTEGEVEEVIEFGVRKILTSEPRSRLTAENIIEFGVKETFDYMDQNVAEWQVDSIIKDGVKKTKEFGEHLSCLIDDVIDNGVKETKTPGKDGDIMSTVEWMNENNSSSYTKMIDDVIENGVKKTHGVSKNLFWEIGDTIQNGVKKTISRENPSTMVDDIIKKTKADASQNPMGKVTEVLRDGKVSK